MNFSPYPNQERKNRAEAQLYLSSQGFRWGSKGVFPALLEIVKVIEGILCNFIFTYGKKLTTNCIKSTSMMTPWSHLIHAATFRRRQSKPLLGGKVILNCRETYFQVLIGWPCMSVLIHEHGVFIPSRGFQETLQSVIESKAERLVHTLRLMMLCWFECKHRRVTRTILGITTMSRKWKKN